MSLVYAPPGKTSSAGFTNTTSYGVTDSIGQSFSSATDISFNASASYFGSSTMGNSFGVSVVSGDQKSFQVTQSSGAGVQIKTGSDNVDHSKDRFFLCLNCEVIVKQTGPNTGLYTIGPKSGHQADIIDVDVEELQNPQILQDACTQGSSCKWDTQHIHGQDEPGLSVLDAVDFLTILKLDPFVSQGPTAPLINTGRFVYQTSRPLEGPDDPNQPPTSWSFTESEQNVQTTSQTGSDSYTVGLTTGGGVGFGGFFDLKTTVSDKFTYQQSWGHSESTGATHQESVTLGTSTVGCLVWADVYEDEEFHTFVYVLPQDCAPPTTHLGPVLSGKVSNSLGHPLPHVPVFVTLANGMMRRILTNSRGEYVLYSGPAGPARITVGQTALAKAIVGGKTTTADFVLRP